MEETVFPATFTISLFDNCHDNKPRPTERTWAELCARMADPLVRKEKDGALFSPAVFDPPRRAKKNVVAVSILVLDYDHHSDIDRDCQVWRDSGLNCAVYTTHSSYQVTESNPDAEERFRVMIPLAEPIPAALFPSLWQWAVEYSGGKNDKSAKDSSRMFYTPVKCAADARYRFELIEGDGFLDWKALELKEPVAYVAPNSNGHAPKSADKYAQTALEQEVGKVATAQLGNCNDQLNKSAYSLGQLAGSGLLSESEIEFSLERAAMAAGMHVGSKGGGIEGIRATIRSGLTAGMAEPRQIPEKQFAGPKKKPPPMTVEPDEFPQVEIDSEPIQPEVKPQYWRQTHEGVAKILIDRHSNDLRFVYDLAKGLKDSEYFAVWDGQKWETSALAVVRLAEWQREMTFEIREAARDLLAALAQAEVAAHEVEAVKSRLKPQLDDAQKKFLAFSANAESTTFKSAWQQQIKTYQNIQIRFTDFDQNPWLLNCKNGTLDLKNGKLMPFRREDYITKQIDVAFDPDAKAPTWEAFLNRIFQRRGEDGKMEPDTDLIGYLQKAVGYSITGQTTEECFFLCWGTGGNGKSKFLGAISDLLGPYAAAPSIETFLDAKRNSQGASEDIASLRGAYLAVSTEPDDGARLAAGLLKRMSGRDEMTARFLFQNSFKFKPTHKLWLLVNEEPQLNGADGGMKRRLRKIPFTAQLSEDEINKNLDEELRSELPGILNWALEGVARWQQEELKSPEIVKTASDSYFTDQDSIQAFIDEKCYVEPTVSTSKPGILYEAYVRFCEQNRIKPMLKNRFGRELTKKGFELDGQGKTRSGIRLSNADSPPDDAR